MTVPFDPCAPVATVSEPYTTPYTACAKESVDVFYFPFPTDNPQNPQLVLQPCDTTGHFAVDASYYTWSITVDLAASVAAQALLTKWKNNPWSMPNSFQVGCSQLNGLSFDSLLCFLDELVPAHTTLVYKVAP